jgi:hypothetical protein
VPPHTAVTTILYGSSKQEAKAKQLATLYPGAKVESGGPYATEIVVNLGDDYAAAHPKPGQGTSTGAPTSGSTAPTTGSTAAGSTLPTDIANNSRTADQDICSGITAGYGAGTG